MTPAAAHGRAALTDPHRLRAVAEAGLPLGAGDEVLDRCAHVAATGTGAPIGAVSLVDAETNRFAGRHGLDLLEVPLSHSMCRHVIERGLPFVVADTRQDPLVRRHPATQELGLGAYAGVPLRLRDGRLVGALCAMSDTPRHWTAEQLAVLEDLAHAAAAQLDLRRVRTATAEVLLFVLRERDGELAEHVDGVARLAARTAQALGLPADEVDRVRTAALLHDVGKVGVPEAILHKPGPLDDAEWAVVQQHTIIGERILRAAPGLDAVATLVRSSHERWDGRGYPDGLAGEAIPIGSRIVLACDAFEAITADRPYRRGRTTAEAVAELRACAGTQFDPAVVEAFTRALAS